MTSVQPSEVTVEIQEKKQMSSHPLFKKSSSKPEYVNATYYDVIHPVPFTTRVDKLVTEHQEVDHQVKDSQTTFYLLGFIPIMTSVTHKLIKEKTIRTSYFCEITPQMEAWMETMKPYFQDLVRHRGKLNFKPSDEEINSKSHILVYPFIVEYGGVTGIGWKRYQSEEDKLPV